MPDLFLRDIDIEADILILRIFEEAVCLGPDGLEEVERFWGEFRTPREDEYVVEEPVEAFDLAIHHGMNLFLFVGHGVLFEHFVAAANTCQRVPDFVGDFCGELAEVFEAFTPGLFFLRVDLGCAVGDVVSGVGAILNRERELRDTEVFIV